MILQVLSSSRGGAASHVLALAEGLTGQGERVAVAMPLDGGNVAHEHFERAGVTVIPYLGLHQLARNLQTMTPVVVHAHGSRAAVRAFLALVASRSAARFYYSIHGFVTPFHREPRRTLQLLMERLVGFRCRALIADAEAERREALRFGLASPERVHTVYLGFDLQPLLDLNDHDRVQARRDLRWDESAWHLLNICRLDRPRDFPTLLEAFARLAPGAHLHIVGGGPLKEAVEERVRDLDLAGRVTVWGLVPMTRPFYAAADAFVLTSWGWEGCPVTAIEAQAAGLPVVVTDAGGSSEAIVPEVSGLLVPRQAPEALAAALTRIRGGHAMGAAGRAHVRENFQLQRMVSRMRALYSRP